MCVPSEERPGLLLFEWFCGGGLLLDGVPADSVPELWQQGFQMLSAVAADFCAAGWPVMVPCDSRPGGPAIDSWTSAVGRSSSCAAGLGTVTTLPLLRPADLRRLIMRCAAKADLTLAIAPETGGRLQSCSNWMRRARPGSALNPDLAFTRLTADKNRLQAHLSACGIPVPEGWRVRDFLNSQQTTVSGQLVLKPTDGCGGDGVGWLAWPQDRTRLDRGRYDDWRLERWAPGIPASVMVLMGPDRVRLLPPMRQALHPESVGRFVKCVDDLSGDAAARAIALAGRTVAALPRTAGCFGIDMVIGTTDVVIEVNPRVTMSWCYLRDKLPYNLAAELVETATPPAGRLAVPR